MAVCVETAAAELKDVYSSGKTRTYEWRVSQLKALLKIALHHEKEILEALRYDLGKHEHKAFLHEIAAVISACRMALKQLHRWVKPEKVKTSMTTFSSSAELVSEPYGVVLVISTWNYPILLSLEPVIAAISAGNAVALKPSEVAPATVKNIIAKNREAQSRELDHHILGIYFFPYLHCILLLYIGV